MARTPSIFKSGYSAKKAYPKPVLLQNKYRSRLEERVAEQLSASSVPFEYEKLKLQCVIPARVSKYTPDFVLGGKIVVECKGYPFDATDRQKLLLIKEQNPEIDLRIVFYDENKPIYKGSKTTMASWAKEHKILCSHKVIPDSWIQEITDAA